MDSRREHLRPTPALRRGLTAAPALAILALAGCGGSTPTTGTAATAAGFTCPNNGTVRMGVEPYDDAAKLLPVLQSVAQQLGTKLGCTVELTVATNYTAEIEAMRNGKLEIGEFGPLGYVLAHQVARAQAVATYTDRSGGPATYTASIVSPQGSGIARLADVAGHSFAYSDVASTSGHLFPAYALKKSGIDPDTGVQALYAGSHTAAFEAIRNRKVDAGELNSNTITSATASGEYKPADYVTLWQSDPIPQDPICVRGDLPASFTKKLSAALAAIDLSTVADPGKVLLGPGFTAQPDSAYTTIRDLVSTLKLDLNNLPK
ncbi:MAG TPA: phosphate/phosphite/phosphonate ABC transporter substrate-binding protein [Candidatus Dormibacteraeota bacterium]|jgi:phosphonate transport system substrate-binding protein